MENKCSALNVNPICLKTIQTPSSNYTGIKWLMEIYYWIKVKLSYNSSGSIDLLDAGSM
jgi:hypothetical protein